MFKALWQPTHPAHLAFPALFWSVWFVLLYGGLSVGCTVWAPEPTQGPFTWINASVLLLTLVATSAHLWWGHRCWRSAAPQTSKSPERFVARVAVGVHLISAVAALAVGLPAIALPPCL